MLGSTPNLGSTPSLPHNMSSANAAANAVRPGLPGFSDKSLRHLHDEDDELMAGMSPDMMPSSMQVRVGGSQGQKG